MMEGPLTLSPSEVDVLRVMSGFCGTRVAVTCSTSSRTASVLILPACGVRDDHDPAAVALYVDAREAQRAAGRLPFVLHLRVADAGGDRGVAVNADREVVLLDVAEKLARAGFQVGEILGLGVDRAVAVRDGPAVIEQPAERGDVGAH